MRSALLLMIFALPAAAEDPAKINEALKRGADYLLANPGAWNSMASYGIGPHCLGGLALLEAGVKPDHATLVALHRRVQEASVREAGCYQVSLAIIFLDRYGSAADVGLIQILGARLMAGQTFTGGWGYRTFDELVATDEARVRGSLGTAATKERLNSEAARILNGVQGGQRASVAAGGDDNSNTQFAIVGLWVARRNGVPADPALLRTQTRFLRSQSPADAGWSYSLNHAYSSPSMSCAGLLALAAGKACAESEPPPLPGVKPEPPQEADPFLKPPPPGAKAPEEDAEAPPPPKVDPGLAAARDKAIERGITGLGKLLQSPGGISQSGTGDFGGRDDLYFYWSLERVAVAYGLDTLGGVDWHDWGCKAILPNQQADGSWIGHYSTPVVSTAFAMLFLKKANFTSDLSRKIAGKVADPGSGELRGGKGNLPGTIPGKGTRQAPDDAPRNDPAAPNINVVRRTTEADALAAALAAASDREWPAKLKKARDAKGPAQTVGLTQAIALLEGKRLHQARAALAERLTRMTSETLKRMLQDRDAELRRAACLAVAMKDDRLLLSEVIERLLDPNDLVLHAAKASLKAVSGEDHGPASGDDDDAKRKAADAWRLWHAVDQRKEKP